MATELKLNTATSIVDFLKSQGKPSDFSSRKTLFNSSGLSERLGSFIGSSSQNSALLARISSNQSPVEDATTPIDTGVNPGAVEQTPEQRAAADNAAVGGAPPEDTVGNSGISASEALSSIPGIPTADEILGQVFESPSFRNFQQGQELNKTIATGDAEAQKQGLETKTAADTQAFINSIGRRGLFFSGQTQTGLTALAESLASSKLGVDRKLAGELLQSDLKTKAEIIDQVGDIVKQAQNGRKEAIAALEKVGLTVIGDEVVPTLAAKREERQIESEQRLAETAAFNQAATEERIRLSQESAERAAVSLQLAIDRAAGNGVVTSGGLRLDNTVIGDVAKSLNDSRLKFHTDKSGASRASDGWADPTLYEDLYFEWVKKGGLPQDFKKSFPPAEYINPDNDSILPSLRNNKDASGGAGPYG